MKPLFDPSPTHLMTMPMNATNGAEFFRLMHP